jgi:hypothetical protein
MNMSNAEQDPVGEPSSVTATTVARELLAGLVGIPIALVCVLPPLLHLVTGPLGPFIGGFAVARHIRPGMRGRAIIAGVIGSGLAGIGATAAFAIRAYGGKEGAPSWFPSADTIGLILAGVWLYATALSAAGATVGASVDRSAR